MVGWLFGGGGWMMLRGFGLGADRGYHLEGTCRCWSVFNLGNVGVEDMNYGR